MDCAHNMSFMIPEHEDSILPQGSFMQQDPLWYSDESSTDLELSNSHPSDNDDLQFDNVQHRYTSSESEVSFKVASMPLVKLK